MSDPRATFYLDTCFLLCLLKENDALHANAVAHFEHLLRMGHVLKVSTIAVAEFCVKEPADSLPLRHVRLEGFAYRHACRAGELTARVLEERHRRGKNDAGRRVVLNDVKMVAQLACEEAPGGWVTADAKFAGTFEFLKGLQLVAGQFVDIHRTCKENFVTLFD